VPALDLRSDAAVPPAREVSTPRPLDRRILLAIAATVVTMTPALLVLAKFAFRDVLLTGDFGVIDARVRDVWHGSLPLLGPYSNGWSHPGPLYYYVLAPLSALFDGASWTIVAGGAILHLLAIALSARLAWRRGGLSLTLLVLAVFALATLGASDRVLLDAWNPHVAMPFFALFVLQLWSVMLRDRWQLLGATIVGSFLVQTHLGYAPLVAAGFATALVGVLLDAHRSDDAPRLWARPLGVSVGAALVLWLPTIYEQLTGDPGNLTLIYRYFRDSPEGHLGLHAGAGTFAALYRPVPVWLGGPERFVPLTFQPRPASLWWLLVPAALLVAAGAAAARRRLAAEGRLVALVGMLTLVGVLALSRVKEEAWTYMSLWRLPLAILVVAVALNTFWRAWADPPPLVRTLGIGVLCLAILGGVVPISRDILRTRHVASFHDDVAAVIDQLADRRPAGTVLVRNVAPALRGVAPTLVDVLDREGVDARVDPPGARAWGTSRTARVDEVDRVWIVTEDGMRGSQLRAVPGAHVIARTSPLPAAEERELSRLQREVALQLADAGRSDLVPWLDYRDFVPLVPKEVPSVDAAKVDRIAQLVRKAVAIGGCRCTVVAFRPDELPGALTDG
jgi:hypothetical protein